MLLCHDCSVYGVHADLSSLQHADADFILIATQRLAEEEPVRYYYGTLVYSDESTIFDWNKTYGENKTALIETYYKEYAIQSDVGTAKCHGHPHNLWDASAKFCCIQYIYNQRHLISMKQPLLKNAQQTANVKFDETLMVGSDKTRSNKIAIRSIRNISPCEELFVNY